MGAVSLSAVVTFCEKSLNPSLFQDYDGAVNGLQVENRGKITQIAAAVDASLATVQKAIDVGANLMIVHHGLFWGPTVPWVGAKYRLLRLLLENDLAVYSMHLPLDGHPILGNAAQLARALGMKCLKPFFMHQGQAIGVQTQIRIDRRVLVDQLSVALGGRVTVLPGGPAECRKIGICTGGAGSQLKQAAREGVDTLITGEGPHWTFALAEELGMNVLYGGHYATETFGVRALAQAISEKFLVPWDFIDHPTGL